MFHPKNDNLSEFLSFFIINYIQLVRILDWHEFCKRVNRFQIEKQNIKILDYEH